MSLDMDGYKLRSPAEFKWSMPVTAPSGGYTAGQMVKIGDTVGVIVETKTIGQTAVLVFDANHIVVPCAAVTTGGYAIGTAVFFDATNARVTTTRTSGFPLCGVVTTAPAVGAEEVEIALNGMLGIAE